MAHSFAFGALSGSAHLVGGLRRCLARASLRLRPVCRRGAVAVSRTHPLHLIIAVLFVEILFMLGLLGVALRLVCCLLLARTQRGGSDDLHRVHCLVVVAKLVGSGVLEHHVCCRWNRLHCVLLGLLRRLLVRRALTEHLRCVG